MLTSNLEERFAIVKRHALRSYMKAIWESWNVDLAYLFFNTLHKAISESLVVQSEYLIKIEIKELSFVPS